MGFRPPFIWATPIKPGPKPPIQAWPAPGTLLTSVAFSPARVQPGNHVIARSLLVPFRPVLPGTLDLTTIGGPMVGLSVGF